MGGALMKRMPKFRNKPGRTRQSSCTNHSLLLKRSFDMGLRARLAVARIHSGQSIGIGVVGVERVGAVYSETRRSRILPRLLTSSEEAWDECLDLESQVRLEMRSRNLSMANS